MIAPEPSARWIAFDQTFIEPGVLALTAVLGILLLFVDRRFASVPFLFAACLIPVGQRIAIATLDFPMVRLLLLCGLLRIILRREHRGLGRSALDGAILLSAALSSAVYILQQGSGAAVINRLGGLLDALGTYFLFRALLRDIAALRILLQACAVLAIPLAAVMSFEWLTGRNLFAGLGGVPEFTHIRHGRLRCQGPFPHAILAGSFGAALFSLCIGLTLQRSSSRWLAGVGACAATGIVFLSASAGPIFSWLAGIGGWGAWLARRHLRPLIWGTGLGLVTLQLFMNNPIWHLITRLAVIGGATAYHRYLLIDQFLRRFPEWALLGTSSTAHWGRGLGDVTNYYVHLGVQGGIWGLGAFLFVLRCAFRNVGRAVRTAGRIPGLVPRQRRNLQFAFWGIGAALLTHCTAFVGVSYYGQIGTLFQIFLAMTACAERWSHSVSLSPGPREHDSGPRAAPHTAPGDERGRTPLRGGVRPHSAIKARSVAKSRSCSRGGGGSGIRNPSLASRRASSSLASKAAVTRPRCARRRAVPTWWSLRISP